MGDIAVAMIPPPFRMVVVAGYVFLDGKRQKVGSEIWPVVAIRTTVHSKGDEINEVLALHLDSGEIIGQKELDDDHPAYELVICPWPESEDASRLVDRLDRVKRFAKQSIGREKKPPQGEAKSESTPPQLPPPATNKHPRAKKS